MFDPYTYRCPAGHPDPCPVCTGAPHLEEILQYEGAHTVAAVILETVTGTNGIIVPPDGYLQSIREIVRQARHPADRRRGDGRLRPHRASGSRSTTGTSSRTSSRWRRASTPATSRSARWRSASRSPTGCATSISPGGLTYSGHPLACAVGVASIEAFREEGIVEHAAEMGDVVRRRAARARGEASVDRRGARARLLLGARAREVARDARAARAVQRRRARRPRRSRACRRRRSSAASI